jgi:hypothetical protein
MYKNHNKKNVINNNKKKINLKTTTTVNTIKVKFIKKNTHVTVNF